jgi:hypothetical protein
LEDLPMDTNILLSINSKIRIPNPSMKETSILLNTDKRVKKDGRTCFLHLPEYSITFKLSFSGVDSFKKEISDAPNSFPQQTVSKRRRNK